MYADFLLDAVAELAVALRLDDDRVGVVVGKAHEVDRATLASLDVDELAHDLGDVVARRLDERVVVAR